MDPLLLGVAWWRWCPQNFFHEKSKRKRLLVEVILGKHQRWRVEERLAIVLAV